MENNRGKRKSVIYMAGLFSLLVSMTATACRPGSQLQGAANQKIPNGQDQKVEEPYATSGPSPSSPVTPSSPVPAPAPTTTTLPSEGIDIPSAITGALLYCFKDKVDGAKTTVLCAVEDKTTKKPIKITSKYVSHKFNSAAPAALKVSVRELPIAGYWHAEYSITGSSAEIVSAGLGSVNFAFEGVDIDNKTDSISIKVSDDKRPNFTIQSMKPQNAAPFRCMDLFRMKGDKVVTTPCGVQTSAQDWFVNTDNKIAHTTGVCIKFNAVSSLTIEGDCAAGDTPRFEFAGEQIKIMGTNTCVGLIMPDNSGVDYVGVVTCNTGDITQHWKVNPALLP